jgi:hypothetical protein
MTTGRVARRWERRLKVAELARHPFRVAGGAHLGVEAPRTPPSRASSCRRAHRDQHRRAVEHRPVGKAMPSAIGHAGRVGWTR